MSIRHRILAIGLLTVGLAATVSAAPQLLPDVIVYDVGVNGADTNDITYWGTNVPGTIAAYNFGTQSCNAGTLPLDWFTASGDTRHPVIGQNMFRIKDGRIEHIGQSWLKHGFCAVNEFESECGPCTGTPCDSLGVGCADTYWATLNDGRGGWSKRFVNAADGTHVEGGGNPTGGSIVRGRLQVMVTDIDPAENEGAEWVIEGQYVTADDTAAGNGHNNASWRRIQVNDVDDVLGGGPTHREEPAIYAWQHFDPEVEVRRVDNVENGVTTHYFLGYRVENVGPGRWTYEYALQNLTSSQCAGSVSISRDPSATISAIGFHGSRYHSGDPFDQTPWPGTDTGTTVDWATDSFATNPDANALRWGTLYNFRFEANTAPDEGQFTIGLFEPGANSSIVVMRVPVPGAFPILDPLAPSAGAPASGPTVGAPQLFSRNGSGGNPGLLDQLAPASIGERWRGALTGGDGLLFVGQGGPIEGLFNDFGEVLVLPPYRTLAPQDGEFHFYVPRNPELVGTTVHLQAAAHTPGGWRLTNALDVTIGL